LTAISKLLAKNGGVAANRRDGRRNSNGIRGSARRSLRSRDRLSRGRVPLGGVSA